ncbi:MAG: 30S ribosomal protein S5 [bacterium JZ-2024 1]
MEKPIVEEVVEIKRVTKVVAGGKRLKFRATVVVGDEDGRVGLGIAKAPEVVDAVRKARVQAEKNLFSFPLLGTTIPHEVQGKVGSTRLLLKPAVYGTGIVAGGSVRMVLRVAGVRDVLAKARGATNAMNLAKATIEALKKLRDPRFVAQIRGVPLQEIWPYPNLPQTPFPDKGDEK